MVGLSVAVVVYPFLHETGHSIVSLAVGAEIVDFSLLPLPYVTCEVSMVSKFGLILIGLSGIYLPMIFSLIIRPKSFWLWYGVLLIKGICLLSFIISLISIILNKIGIKVLNEDIVQIMDIWIKGDLILSVLMFLSITIVIRSIMKEKPINRIMLYFRVPMKKASAA